MNPIARQRWPHLGLYRQRKAAAIAVMVSLVGLGVYFLPSSRTPVAASDPQACVWRLLLPVTSGARVAAAIKGEVLYDWGGSQIFIKTSAEDARSQATSPTRVRREVA